MECRMDTFQIGLLVAIGLAVLLPGAILCFGISSEIARAKRRLNKPLVCDDCGTPDVRPSWPAGMQDRLMAAFGYSPYRCRACNYRFYQPQRPIAD